MATTIDIAKAYAGKTSPQIRAYLTEMVLEPERFPLLYPLTIIDDCGCETVCENSEHLAQYLDGWDIGTEAEIEDMLKESTN